MASVKENLANIRERMAAAAHRAGRDPDSVQLVAVSKRMPVALIQEAVDAGQRVFGENYLQDAQDKVRQLGPDIAWHFIGHLQSNKAATAAQLFHTVETVDRLKIARALDKNLAKLGKTMAVLVQVNIGKEPQKSGVLPEDVELLLQGIAACGHIEVRGLMAMAPFLPQPELVRPYFRQTRQLADALAQKGLLGGHGRVELSMGMSGDFEVAIEEGATLVRVGTALFGARQ